MIKNSGALKRLMPLIKKHSAALIFSILLAAAAVVLQLYVPVLFGDAIDFVQETGSVDFTAMAKVLSKIAFLAVLSGVFT